jgi:hypothetical protein
MGVQGTNVGENLREGLAVKSKEYSERCEKTGVEPDSLTCRCIG